jgi:hypothetical protein
MPLNSYTFYTHKELAKTSDELRVTQSILLLMVRSVNKGQPPTLWLIFWG